MSIRNHVRLQCEHDGCPMILDAIADEGCPISSKDAEAMCWVADGFFVYCPVHRSEYMDDGPDGEATAGLSVDAMRNSL